mgnify:CR=1 FL=1
MTGTDHKKGSLLRKEFLHLFLPVEIADLDDGVIFITGHLLLKDRPKSVEIRFMLFFYVFKYVVKYPESVDVPYRYKYEHDQQKD